MNVPNLFSQVALVFFAFILSSYSQTKSIVALPIVAFSTEDAAVNELYAVTESQQFFFNALKEADLDCLLHEDENYTIFVPSNKAFENISKTKLQSLLNAEDKMQLKSMLKYHIIKGKLSASKILKALCRGGGRTTLTTMQGTKIRVTFKNTDIILTDNTGNSARITIADLNRHHGVVHQIDQVILPSRI